MVRLCSVDRVRKYKSTGPDPPYRDPLLRGAGLDLLAFAHPSGKGLRYSPSPDLALLEGDALSH